MNDTYPEIHLATVTDKSFFQGTLVMIHSFLMRNKWFQGKILIIEDDLDDHMKAMLSLYPGIDFHTVSPDLHNRLQIFTKVLPHYSSKVRKFYMLDVFKLEGLDQLLFLDSDILCTGDLKTLFELRKKGLVAARDKSAHLGEMREEHTFLSFTKMQQKANKSYLDCFNSGMLLINYDKLDKNIFQDLLGMISPMKYATVQTGHADQYLLNIYFKDKTHLVSARWNFLLHCEEAILQSENIRPVDAELLHYVKSQKPWKKGIETDTIQYKKWHKAHEIMLTWLQSHSTDLHNEYMERYPSEV